MQALRALQARGFTVWAAETCAQSVPFTSAPLPALPARDGSGGEGGEGCEGGCAIVLGNEVVGVHVDALEAADAIVTVPMFGIKNSLNIGVCTALLVFDVLRRWNLLEAADGGLPVGSVLRPAGDRS